MAAGSAREREPPALHGLIDGTHCRNRETGHGEVWIRRRLCGRDYRFGRRRRHAGERVVPEGHQGGGSRSGGDAVQRQLHQRRVEVVRATCLAGCAHDLGQLSRGQGFPGPAGLDLQDRGWHDNPLGWRLAALPGARIQGPHPVWPHRGRQSDGLAARAAGARAVVREGRRQDGRDPYPRDSRPARQQQLQGHVRRGEQARLQGRTYRQHGHQQPAAGRSRTLPAARLLFPGVQERSQVVHPLHRAAQGGSHRQARSATRITRYPHRAQRRRQGERRGLFRQGRQGTAAKGAYRLRGG